MEIRIFHTHKALSSLVSIRHRAPPPPHSAFFTPIRRYVIPAGKYKLPRPNTLILRRVCNESTISRCPSDAYDRCFVKLCCTYGICVKFTGVFKDLKPIISYIFVKDSRGVHKYLFGIFSREYELRWSRRCVTLYHHQIKSINLYFLHLSPQISKNSCLWWIILKSYDFKSVLLHMFIAHTCRGVQNMGLLRTNLWATK